MTNNLGKNFANRALKKNNGTTQRATTRARSKQTVSDEDNYLLKTTRKIKTDDFIDVGGTKNTTCLLYASPSPRDS